MTEPQHINIFERVEYPVRTLAERQDTKDFMEFYARTPASFEPKTFLVLSRCHLTDRVWVPEQLSRLGMEATVMALRQADQKRNSVKHEGSYVKPLNWTAKERETLAKWRKEQAPSVDRGGYSARTGQNSTK